MLFLLDLCNELGIDAVKAAEEKLEKNRKKYPVEKAKGNARKYSKYE